MMIRGRGVVVRNSITRAELAMLLGLAHVVQRLGVNAPLRYLTGPEVAALSSHVTDRYRELASANRARASA